MKVSFAQFAGLSLDLLKEVKPEEADLVEFIHPDMVIEIPDKLYHEWYTTYHTAIRISEELETIHRNQHGG